MFIFQKYETNSNKIFIVVKIFHSLYLKMLTKYLGTSINYNLICYCYQLLMAFINRPRVLGGTVIFKGAATDMRFCTE